MCGLISPNGVRKMSHVGPYVTRDRSVITDHAWVDGFSDLERSHVGDHAYLMETNLTQSRVGESASLSYVEAIRSTFTGRIDIHHASILDSIMEGIWCGSLQHLIMESVHVWREIP